MEENTTKPIENEPDTNHKEIVDVKEATSDEKPTESPLENSNNSEYETVDESGEEEDGQKEDENNDDRRRSEHSVSQSESEGSVILERQEGDGQESAPTKKVDDDEDKKNPQYIPKRGTFYEHDDRTADDAEAPDAAEAEKENKKKVWQDKKERWSHDKFNDSEQAPKSRSELIAIYGYDIRNEDGPPRARRRRRYGRGPNKYTRNWEDEDAYGKPPVSKPKKLPVRKPRRSSEEFPPLRSEAGERKPTAVQEKEQEVAIKEKHVQEERSSTSTQQNYSSNSNYQQEIKSVPPQNGKTQQRIGSGRVIKPNREIKDSDYKGFTRPRNYKSSRNEQKPPSPSASQQQHPPSKKSEYIQSQNFTNKNKVQELEGDMSKLSMQDGLKNGGKQNNQRQGSVPPRLQGEQKSSKRYSSLRQRSLPETAAPPPFGQVPQTYFPNVPNEFNQTQPAASTQQQIIHPATTQVPQIPPPPISAIPQQVSAVSATPILQAPPQFGAPFPQAPPAFLQAGVPPSAFIPQQTPLLNYVQNQAQFTQAPYQGFQQAYNTVSPPTELYQPQGGITYYSAQEQQVAQRAAPLKRPKAAIPIVPPPPSEPRGRGRGMNQPESSPNSGIETAPDNNTYEINKEFEDATIAVEQ